MSKVLSHIIQKRFSKVNEDVATDALAYILETSQAASNGMRKLLCGLLPELPLLRFKTQETEEAIRPDMWGFDGMEPRVFIENKFWAGLTDNQPVNYLKQLSACPKPSILLVVAPAARQHTLWRELQRRTHDMGVMPDGDLEASGIHYAAQTNLGPILAITSWDKLLTVLEHETIDEPETRGDLTQLRALCNAADSDAFKPLTNEELSDQRSPAFILGLSSLWQSIADLGVSKGILSTRGTQPQASHERIGRYCYLLDPQDGKHVGGIWFGIHFRYWKAHGNTPLWMMFISSEWGRADQAKIALEPWAAKEGVFTLTESDDSFALALDLPVAVEQDAVIEAVLQRFDTIRKVLASSRISRPAEDENPGTAQ